MNKRLFNAPIDLHKHTSLIYGEGVFGLDARKTMPMRAKTADGILRYAKYEITGVVDSKCKEKNIGEVLPAYIGQDSTKGSMPIFKTLDKARAETNADVLILGVAPEGGELPKGYKRDITWAIKNKIHIVSGLHYALSEDADLANLSKKHNVVIWDVRHMAQKDLESIPMCSAQAYHVKKPIVLTVGTDAAIGKMTVAYEMAKVAERLGHKSAVIPTGQTSMMIEGWGAPIDALPADFMAGAVEQMIVESSKMNDMLFVEGQGSLFHPAYANTCISLVHGAVPTHMVLVHRPQRKHSIGSRLVKLPDLGRAIRQYESSVLPFYRNAKVVAIAINSDGLSEGERKQYKEHTKKKYGLETFDAIYDKEIIEKIVKAITL
jgi:uncharacterized NAD-dependent epimerase/dehydratase family protein